VPSKTGLCEIDHLRYEMRRPCRVGGYIVEKIVAGRQ
jgi:hypothetical protein